MFKKEDINHLYVYMMVAREESFTRAAAKLGQAQSGVSRSVSELENRLGIKLLTRSTRNISMTPAGEQLFLSLEKGFGNLENGWELITQLREDPSGIVRINASRQAIESLLLPKLISLRNDYPRIELELVENNTFVDIVKERYDAGVRYGNTVDEGMVAVRIGPNVQMAVVASPEFLKKYGYPAHPCDLTRFPCIGYRISDGSAWSWEFNDGDRYIKHKPQGGWLFNDASTIIQAAVLGCGLAYEAEDLMQEELQSRKLIKIFEQYCTTFTGYHLYYPHRKVSTALRIIIETLKVHQ